MSFTRISPVFAYSCQIKLRFYLTELPAKKANFTRNIKQSIHFQSLQYVGKEIHSIPVVFFSIKAEGQDNITTLKMAETRLVVTSSYVGLGSEESEERNTNSHYSHGEMSQA